MEEWTDREIEKFYLCKCGEIPPFCSCREEDDWEDELAIDIALEEKAFRNRK